MEEQAHPLRETSRDAEPWSWTGSRGPLMFGVGLCLVSLVVARTIIIFPLCFSDEFPLVFGLGSPCSSPDRRGGKRCFQSSSLETTNNPEKVLASSFTSLGGSHTSETADTLVGGLSQCCWTETQLLGCLGYFVIENCQHRFLQLKVEAQNTRKKVS